MPGCDHFGLHELQVETFLAAKSAVRMRSAVAEIKLNCDNAAFSSTICENKN